MSEASETAQPAGAPIRFGRFELLERIGRGGMAEVYRAKVIEGHQAGEVVALKRLLPEMAADLETVELFAGEADVCRWLDHPNIIRITDAGVVGEHYFMTMDFIDGRDLKTILARCRERKIFLPLDFSNFIALSLLDALAYAHGAFGPNNQPLMLVHCDVTPANVFISRLGEIKLGDFGVAKVRSLEGESPHPWGKVSYSAPELIKGEPVDPRVDLWSVGVVLYEMLANRRPFTGTDDETIARAVLNKDPPSLRDIRPDIPVELDAIVLTALQKEPSSRYQTAELFFSDLEPLCDKNIGTPLAIAAVVRGLFSL